MDRVSALRQLEALLTRFFSNESTNEEKLEINKILESFGRQQGVWKYCTYFLQQSANPHVLMYSLNVLESTVMRLWPSLDSGDKGDLRCFLMDHLLLHYASLPAYLSNKFIKIIVLVGRVAWPHEYPEFFDQMMQLCRSLSTNMLGLTFLLIASEELAAPRGDTVPTARRQELAGLMARQSGPITSLVVEILDSYAEKQRHKLTPTPPPSPCNSPIKTTPDPYRSTNEQELISFCPPQRPSYAVSYSPLDKKSEESSTLPTWGATVPLTSRRGLEALALFAMDCINELMVKNYVPRELEAFLMKLFEKSFGLLQRLVGNGQTPVTSSFSHLDDRFLAKCSDFFYWFVSSHLKRLENNPNFPVTEFLELFCKYTFKQAEVDSFCVCLDIWGALFDHLITAVELPGSQTQHCEQYRSTLVSMASSVLEKIQFNCNIDELREIDDDTVDDDNETEWQSFLRQCVEFLGKVGQLFPSDIFQKVLPLLESYSQFYFSLEQLITSDGHRRHLAISESTDCEKLHAVLKDLASMLQIMGRLADHFVGDNFEEQLSNALMLVNQFSLIAKYSTESMLFNVSTPIPEVLEHDFIVLHAQALGTLQAYTHWLSQLYLTTTRQHRTEDTVAQLVGTMVESATPLIAGDVPEKVVLAACQLLLSLASTVRPKFLTSFTCIQRLMEKATSGQLASLPARAYTMIYKALCSLLVLPWPQISNPEQQWEARTVKPDIKRILNLLEDVVGSLADQQSKSKTALFKAISPSIDAAIALFPVYLHDAVILDSLMGFFLTLFGALKAQLGLALTERTTHTIMLLLTREQMEGTLLQEGSVGSKVIEKFLKILQLLIDNSGGQDRPFLPSIISFAMNQIYPSIAERSAPDVKLALYQLLFHLLLNNWRYFYPATVLAHMDTDDSETIEHEQEFSSIMQSIGQSLMQNDVNVFKENLEHLQQLNSKHNLYSKFQFRTTLLYPFLNLLMQALVQRSHDILQDEICQCLYSMASVDFSFYYGHFVPKFLETVEGLTEEQQATLVLNYRVVEDMPSFVQNVCQFTSDLRYFLILNTTNSPGSVMLS
ncbi:hypothetical protein EMCRGX_G027544 [Ephydatia muelleri]